MAHLFVIAGHGAGDCGAVGGRESKIPRGKTGRTRWK